MFRATHLRPLSAITLALLLAACGGGGLATAPTPTPPPSPVQTVDPSQYTGNTFSTSSPGSAAYVAGIDMENFPENTRDYTVSIDSVYPQPTSQPPGTPWSAGPRRAPHLSDRPASAQETEALLFAYRIARQPLRTNRHTPTPSYSDGQTRQFWVCYQSLSICNASNQVQITATAVATSQRSAIFVDNDYLRDVPADVAQQLLAAADQSWGRITQNLGLPVNQYNPDGTGQVIYLFTRRVDHIDPNIAGFFFPVDLYPDADTVRSLNLHSNEANMLYLNSRYASRSWMLSTVAHELAHLVHYSRRVFVHRTAFDPPYFTEGLAMAMEDVAGYGYNGDGTPLAFVRSFLREAHRVSLLRWGQGTADIRSYYGGAYLMSRYLLDRFGSDALSRIINSTLDAPSGTENISGEPYGRTFASIAIAIVNSSERLNISDPRWRYTSIDVSLAGSLYFLSPGTQPTTPMNWRFIRAQPGGSQVRVTITAGTSKPYAGLIIR